MTELILFCTAGAGTALLIASPRWGEYGGRVALAALAALLVRASVTGAPGWWLEPITTDVGLGVLATATGLLFACGGHEKALRAGTIAAMALACLAIRMLTLHVNG